MDSINVGLEEGERAVQKGVVALTERSRPGLAKNWKGVGEKRRFCRPGKKHRYPEQPESLGGTKEHVSGG